MDFLVYFFLYCSIVVVVVVFLEGSAELGTPRSVFLEGSAELGTPRGVFLEGSAELGTPRGVFSKKNPSKIPQKSNPRASPEKKNMVTKRISNKPKKESMTRICTKKRCESHGRRQILQRQRKNAEKYTKQVAVRPFGASLSANRTKKACRIQP